MTDAASALRVLVVEDNPTNQQLVHAVLRRAGYSVVTAASATEARALLSTQLPDAILMDVELPDIDGLAFTRELVATDRTRRVPIIAVTAHAMRGDEELAYQAGCLGYVTKPVDIKRLSLTLESILSAARR